MDDQPAGGVTVSRNVYDACRYHLPRDRSARGISPRGMPQSPRLSYSGNPDLSSRLGSARPVLYGGETLPPGLGKGGNEPSRSAKEFARFHDPPPMSRRMVGYPDGLGASATPRDNGAATMSVPVSARVSLTPRDPLRWAPGETAERVSNLNVTEGAAGAPADYPRRYDTDAGRSEGLGRSRSATPDYYRRYAENLVGSSLHNSASTSTPCLVRTPRSKLLGACDPSHRSLTPSYHSRQDCRYHDLSGFGRRHDRSSPCFSIRKGMRGAASYTSLLSSRQEPTATKTNWTTKSDLKFDPIGAGPTERAVAATKVESKFDPAGLGTGEPAKFDPIGLRFDPPQEVVQPVAEKGGRTIDVSEKENGSGRSIIWAGAQEKANRALVGARPLQSAAIPPSGVKVTNALGNPELAQARAKLKAGGLPGAHAPGSVDYDIIQSANGTMKVVSPRPRRYEPSPIC
mmetsp:Transcript_28443/g.51716  ORF Transcript_28443/g.51716 Transcript_28443/m.51716 type:complete len:458 (-) Transcript_28443:141-1514(-)